MAVLKLVNKDGKFIWVAEEYGSSSKPVKRKNAPKGEDLTIDGYISKHGGIYSHADGKVHQSKRSYLDGMKANNCHIKDY